MSCQCVNFIGTEKYQEWLQQQYVNDTNCETSIIILVIFRIQIHVMHVNDHFNLFDDNFNLFQINRTKKS